MMTEQWRPVVGYEGLYEVSDHGQVRGVDRIDSIGRKIKGRMLVGSRIKNGRRVVQLYSGGVYKIRNVAILVAEAFIGPRPVSDSQQYDCCHNDDVPSNDVLSNLRWDTHSNNMIDKENHGLGTRGSLHPDAKLNETDVRFIRHWLKSGKWTLRQIGDAFGVHKMTINNIKRGTTWAWLDAEVA